jgi:hypothetical protein
MGATVGTLEIRLLLLHSFLISKRGGLPWSTSTVLAK